MKQSSILALEILNGCNKFEESLKHCIDYNFLSDKTCRLFAVWSYRDTLNWVKNPHPDSIFAADVAERFAYGKATQEELSATSAAWSVAWSAAENRQKDALIRLIEEELCINI